MLNLTDVNGQRGQYFGASLIVTDLNKDGLDDLIVGSPFFTDYSTVLDVKTQEHKPQYDIGKVDVYIQSAAVRVTQTKAACTRTLAYARRF